MPDADHREIVSAVRNHRAGSRTVQSAEASAPGRSMRSAKQLQELAHSQVATHGVPVWRVKHEGFPSIVQPESWTGSQGNADSFVRAVSKVGVSHEVILGTWYPADEATARDAVIEAARSSQSVQHPTCAGDVYLKDALDRLDAIRGAA